MFLPGGCWAAALNYSLQTSCGGEQWACGQLGEPWYCNPSASPGTAIPPRIGCRVLLQNRPNVFLRYRVGEGFTNQLNSHMNALLLAHVMDMSAVLLPPAKSRPHFNHTKNGVRWADQPIGSMLDVEAMRQEWRRRGLELLEVGGAWRLSIECWQGGWRSHAQWWLR